MANELPNAAALLTDPVFRSWVTAASVYQARLTMLEADTVPDHAARYALARMVLSTPGFNLDLLVGLLATDDQIAGLGPTPTTAAVWQGPILTKIAAYWTPVSLTLGLS